MSGAAAGLFDILTVTTGSSKIVNSPLGIIQLFGGLSGILIFLYPSIIGVSVYRDYESQMHTILYSYPFTKLQYLLAKFFSGIFIVNIIVLIVAFGIVCGFVLPGTNPDIIVSFDLKSYTDVYFIYILPNMLFMGAIVFGIVTFTRNISAGFITVLILLILQNHKRLQPASTTSISPCVSRFNGLFIIISFIAGWQKPGPKPCCEKRI